MEKKTNKKSSRPRKGKPQRRSRRAPTSGGGMSAMQLVQYKTPLFAASRLVKGMLYSELLTLNSTSGVPTQKFIIANGLYDPNVQTGGHQPSGFDIMMSLYEQYTVVSSRVSVTFSNDNTTVNNMAVVFLSPDTTVLTDPNMMLENGLLRSVVLNFKGTMGCCKTINLACDVAKYFGRKGQRELLDDTSLQGTASANPTEGVYFALGLWDFTEVATSAAFVRVEVAYDAIFWEPRKLATD